MERSDDLPHIKSIKATGDGPVPFVEAGCPRALFPALCTSGEDALSTVAEIKAQYARVLKQDDWKHFKEIAEYYLRVAAELKGRDIPAPQKRLLLRNSQKRLFLGIGCELLLKSFYLRSGYCINKFRKQFTGRKAPINKLADVPAGEIDPEDTFTMNPLIDNLSKVKEFQALDTIKRGFQVAMTFRNKEGHVTFPHHKFVHENYKDISEAVTAFYLEAFGQTLRYQIAMKPKEKAIFQLKNSP